MARRFPCGACDKIYSTKYNLIKHVRNEHKERLFVCEHCPRLFIDKAELDVHQNDFRRRKISLCQFCKKEFLSEKGKKAHEKKFHPATLPDQGDGTIVFCSICERSYQKRYWYSHQRSEAHMDKLLKDAGDRVKVFESAFGNRCTTYRISANRDDELVDSALLLENVRAIIAPIIERELIVRGSLRFRLTLVTVHHRLVDALDDSNWEEATKHFNSSYRSASGRDDFDKDFSEAAVEVLGDAEAFDSHQSGWALLENLFVLVNVLTQQLAGASSYLPLPEKLSRKNAIVNIHNTDSRCFLFCAAYKIYGKYIDRKKQHLQESYLPYLSSFDVANMQFPLTLLDIGRFERLNWHHEISVNIYTYEHNNFGVLRLTKKEKLNHMDLLLIGGDTDFHYTVITDLSRLLTRQISRHHGAKVFCRECLSHFPSSEDMKLHKEIKCLGTKLEVPKVSYLEFKHYYAKNRLKFIVYGDLETLCVKVAGASGNPEKSYTRPLQMHRVYASGYKFVSFNRDKHLEAVRTFPGIDSLDRFLDSLLDDCEYIMKNYYWKKYKMTELTPESKQHFDSAKICFICDEPLDRVIDGVAEVLAYDHDHHLPPETPGTNCRGRVHSRCNLLYQEKHHIPCVFHSAASLDWHALILAISKRRNGTLSCIAKTSETYITFDWKAKFSSGIGGVNLRFIDSFRFLPRSLAVIVESMTQFPYFEEYFRENYKNEVFNAQLLSKAAIPYEYFDDISKLEETEFPPIEKFYSSLTNESISEEKWKEGKEIYGRLKCKNLFEYALYYMKTDIYFLCDSCEQFRDVGMRYYKLDPLGYSLTLASFAWDACLLFTKKKVPLMQDLNQILFSMQALRGKYEFEGSFALTSMIISSLPYIGGLCYGNVTRVDSNSRYSKDGYDPQKGPESQILLFDIVSLYSKVMSSRMLCDGSYEWVTEGEMKELEKSIQNVPDDGDVGYLLECDVAYPKELHSQPAHIYWPLLAQNRTLKKDGSKKLFTTLYDKKNIILHHVILKQALRKGLKLTKIHRGLKFHQSDWLHSYIKRNIEMRAEAGLSPLYVQILKVG